jgi:hypothetical protein
MANKSGDIGWKVDNQVKLQAMPRRYSSPISHFEDWLIYRGIYLSDDTYTCMHISVMVSYTLLACVLFSNL